MTGLLKQTLTATTAIVLWAATISANEAETAEAPDVLFVFADQPRAEAQGCLESYCVDIRAPCAHV